MVAAAGWAFVPRIPAVYRADARVYVDTNSMLGEVLQGVALDSSAMEEEFLRVTQRSLLSRPNLERIARETDLDLNASDPASMDRLLDRLRSQIRMRAESTRGRSGNENLFTLEYQHRDPERALAVVRAVLDVFVESVLGFSRRDTEKMDRFLDTQIGEYEDRLRVSEQRLKNFKRENVGLLPGEGRNYFSMLQDAREQARQAELELRQAERVRDGIQEQLELARQGGRTGAAALASLDPDRAETIERLERVLADLQLNYTEQHPDVLATRRRLQQLREGAPLAESEVEETEAARPDGAQDPDNVVLQELRVELSKAQANVSSAEAKVEEFRDRAARLEDAVDTIPEVEAELAQLNRDYDVLRGQYQALVQRRESARLSRQADRTADEGLFQVLEPPHVTPNPVSPNRPVLVTGVLGAALAAGAGLAFLLSQYSPTFGDVTELREVTGRHVLGRVGAVRSRREVRSRRFGYALYGLLLMGLLAGYAGVMAVHALGIVSI